MKQLLLRVPEELHQRLTERARRSGRSVNAVANEILDAAADVDQGGRRERLRARATAVGVARPEPGPSVRTARRRRAISSTRGIGPVVDRLLAEDRERG
ncbi:MAG TPA: Arc family DNA-binding protein [Acidimicrobiales bacterium]|nr:Arc family DNA-binding protein [Acidimicrobiales bacterium]